LTKRCANQDIHLLEVELDGTVLKTIELGLGKNHILGNSDDPSFGPNHLDTQKERNHTLFEVSGTTVEARSWIVTPAGDIYFSNTRDNSFFQIPSSYLNENLLIQGSSNVRYSDFAANSWSPETLLAVRDEITDKGDLLSSVVAIEIQNGIPHIRKLLSTVDCSFSSPRWSPDNSKLCWIQWDKGETEWMGGKLFWCEYKSPQEKSEAMSEQWKGDGLIMAPQTVEVQQNEKGAMIEPRWAQDGTLYFLRELDNYRQVYRVVDLGTGRAEKLVHQSLEDSEFGRGGFDMGM
jgi:hypothetical protein